MADKQLRNLSFDIGFKIKDQPIDRANKKVDDYKDTVIETDKATDQLGKETDKTSKKMFEFGKKSQTSVNALNNSIKKLGFGLGAYFTFSAAKRGIESLLKSASALEEETAKFDQVFGGVGKGMDQLSDEAMAWIEEYTERIGRGRLETMKYMSESQNLLVGFGATRAEAFELSKQIQMLGVDLASFNNVAESDALNLLQSGLLGNHRATKSLGIALTETTLKNKALEMGYKKTFDKLDPLTKMQIRLNVALDQSVDAIGDAERTSDSYANQLRRMQGNIEDTKAELGQELIPTMLELMTTVNENKDSIIAFVKGGVNLANKAIKLFGKGVEFSIKHSKILKPVLAGLATTFITLKVAGVVAGIYGIFTGATVAATGATTAFGISLNLVLGPIGIVAAAIGALVASIILLKENWDKVTHIFGAVVEGPTVEIPETVVAGKTHSSNVVRTTGTGRTVQRHERSRGPVTVSPKGKYALGTSSATSGLALVGERGPELVNMRGGETVQTANATRSMLKGTGSMGDTLDINVNINGGDPFTVAMTIRDVIDSYFVEMATKRGLALNG